MWDNPRQLDAATLLLALVATAMLGWGAASWAVRQPAFAFREVVIEGALARASPAHLEAVIREELSGTFFTMDLGEARASLQRVPWVRRIALRRQWPNRLEVTVSEQQPLARWNDAALLNVHGEVFAADYDGELPQFTGPDGAAAEIAARFRDFSDALQPLGLSIGEIRLSPRGGWQLKTTGNPPLTVELGRAEPAGRLARFAAYYAKTIAALAKSGTRIEYADLRYRNGFAARVPGFREKLPKRGA
jgi:cell division protein FtsQ